jgi:DNA-binding transcriptional LysR family regulator
VVVGSPKYLRAHGTPVRPAQLTAHQLIHCTSVTPSGHWRFAGESVPVAPRFVTNSADAAIDFAEQGGGLTAVLAYQVAEAVRRERLKVVLAAHEPDPAPIHLVFPTSRLLSAKVRTFVDLVTRTCDWQFGRAP